MKTKLTQIIQFISDTAARSAVRNSLLAYAAAFPVILFFALEMLHPASADGLMAAPFANIGIILLSALFIACIVAVFYAAVGSVFWAYVITSAIIGTAYVLNNLKLMTAGNVAVPTDFLILGEAIGVTDVSGLTIERALLLRIFLIILLHIPFIFLKFKLQIKKRLIMLGGAIAVFLPVFVFNFTAAPIVGVLGIDTTGSFTAMYAETGFIMGFHSARIDHYQRSSFAGYASEIAEEFFSTHTENQAIGRVAAENIRPNVIVIMSEAFMDPLVLPGVEFSKDPIPNFRRLVQNHISGDLLVPVFGGRTANTEFEFLTGSAMFFMGSGYYVPYSNAERYFFRDIHTSMPNLFRENGYHTVAVHPYYRTFFRRDEVYPRLGFDSFIAYEDMGLDAYVNPHPDNEDFFWLHPNYKGWFVSDEFFTDQMIKQIDQAEQDNQPLFLFGISMQNHWEFFPGKYYHWPRDVYATSPYLGEWDLGTLNSYLQGLYDADKQLGRLIDHLENSETPTIVVFFGDHLPLLGQNSSVVFNQLGYISSESTWLWNEDDLRKMYTLPYLVWANFEHNNIDWGVQSTYTLAAEMLDFSGIYLNRYWHNVLYAGRYFGALTENRFVDNEGNFTRPAGVRERPYIQALEALHHVKWFGDDETHHSLREIIIP